MEPNALLVNILVRSGSVSREYHIYPIEDLADIFGINPSKVDSDKPTLHPPSKKVRRDILIVPAIPSKPLMYAILYLERPWDEVKEELQAVMDLVNGVVLEG